MLLSNKWLSEQNKRLIMETSDTPVERVVLLLVVVVVVVQPVVVV